jgi:hypothetical protein
VPSERIDHRDWQSLARLAVSTRINTPHAQAFRRALRGPAVHRLLARTVFVQHLSHEHRQRHGRRIQPLAMLGQQQIGHLQKFRSGEKIEKIHRLDFTSPAADVCGMLLRKKLGITITQGWPSWLRLLCGNNILPISVVSLLLQFQSVSLTRKYRRGLSQCHSH